ncbi:serine hydrolase [Alteromonas sp. ASW11-36]|uniref:Serine hydrolase n=1 Tax=Alteromonas arenosi TaxID=3055817 RepID=A0ABT7STQ6_9ALTE|nr:serine hydrolase [Alteromonas sp. ASW11-36]MDM7859384.1 serine hydrolase [Alteromonas sp. ASW11-36]
MKDINRVFSTYAFLSGFLRRVLMASTCVCLCSISLASPTAQQSLSDAESDPRKLELMQGFPPPVDKRITLPDSVFFSFPNLRWSVCHMRELLPTANIERHPDAYNLLPVDLDDAIDDIAFTPIDAESSMTWRESLAHNYTDGILILHRGRIVYERYRGCLTPDTRHAAMSMTKSLTGLLAEILIAQDLLDENAKVSAIIPELTESAFGSATVRQVMNMTTAIQYSENYADPNADIWQYAYAANPLPKPDDYAGPVGYFEYLQTVQQQGEHGQVFGYKTVNSDVLGWILARTSGKSYNHLASELVWEKIGAKYSADITVDGLGTPFAGGGLSATLQDLARLGFVVLNRGYSNGVEVIPSDAINSIMAGGDKSAFDKAGFSTMPGGSYQSMWWHFHNANGAFAARGVHGQTIYIAPTADMVIVRLASHPSAANSVIDPTSLPAYEAVAQYLMALN